MSDYSDFIDGLAGHDSCLVRAFGRLCDPTAVWLLLVFTFLTSSPFAQPGWVKDAIEQGEGQIFHGDAPAAVLLKETVTEVSSDGSFKSDRKIVFKVLTSQGAGLCQLIIPVSSGQEEKGIKGWRVRPNGTHERLTKQSIVEIGLTGTTGYYSDDKTVMAQFSSLQTGDVVAYEYTTKGSRVWEGFHHRYTIQQSLPVVSIRVQVKVPSNWVVQTSNRHCESLRFSRDGNVYGWTASSLAYRPEEAFSPPASMIRRQLEVSCYSPQGDEAQYHRDWRGVARWAWNLFEPPIEPHSSIEEIIPSICKGAVNRTDSISAVCEFVRDEIRYVAVELGEGRFRPRTAIETFSNRYGDCKDKVTLARSMLTSIDVQSYAVLARVGFPVNHEFPSPFQFNHAILSIPCNGTVKLDSTSDAFVAQSIYFDPTDESTAFGQLPTSLHGTNVLRVSPVDTDLVTLPMYEPRDYLRRIQVVASLDEEFAMSAHVRSVEYGYRAARTAFRRTRARADEEKDAIVESVSARLSKPTLSNYAHGNDADSAWVEFDLASAGYVSQAGPMMISRVDFLPAMFLERFSGDDRIFPIWFGSPAMEERQITWSVPPAWKLTSTPVKTIDGCGISHFEGTTEISSDTVRYCFAYTCTGDTLSAANYDSACKFERTVNSFQNQQLVLEKRGN